jgi:predicted dehydrogenase
MSASTSTSKPVQYRVGLVGYRRGRALAEAWRGVAGARLVAVADLLPERRDQASEELGGDIACYPDHLAMLEAANLDVLTIATTGGFHAEIVKAATARGIRGIYCEKPMACSLADADAMIADCRAAGTVLTIGHQRRWMEQIRRIRTAIQEGAIGRPTHGYVYWATGRIGTEGTHFLDALSFILDSSPVEVSGTTRFGYDSSKVDDDSGYGPRMATDPGVMGFVTFASGVHMAIDCMPDILAPFAYTFCGTRGRLDVSERGWDVAYQARDEDARTLLDSRQPFVRRAFPPLPAEVRPEAEREGCRELLRCIETGARPTSAGEDGRLALETIVAFHLSAEANCQPVRLPLPASARARSFAIK